MALYSQPKDHQVEGSKFLVTRDRAIIGAKTGRGKTLVVLACIHAHVFGKPDYAIVVAPPKAYDRVWEQETSKHSDMKLIRLPDAIEKHKETGTLDFLLEYDILLMKYTHIKADYYQFLSSVIPNRILACDEAHRLKNPEAKVTRLMVALTKDSKAKWLITATCIGNDIFDMWGLMFFLNPIVLGTYYQFRKQYCELEERIIGWNKGKAGGRFLKTCMEIVDYKNLDILRAKLSPYYWYSGSEIDVKFHELNYEMNQSEMEAYIVAAKGVLEGKDNLKGFAQRLPDIQRTVDGARDKNGEVTSGYRSEKYLTYKEHVQKVIEAGESCIFFAEFIESFEMLYPLLKEDFNVPVYRVSGSFSEAFKEKPCIVLMSLGGSESLNMGFANHVFCYSIPFSVNGFIQLVGRITRLDSDYLDNLNVYVPMSDNIDKYKYEYLKENAYLINEVLGKDANLPKKDLEQRRRGLIDDLRKQLVWKINARGKKSVTPDM